MSHKEKENVISLITTVIISIPYFFYIYNRYTTEAFNNGEELKFLAGAILLLIPIRVIAQIIVYILFSIVKAIITGDQTEPPMITDEREAIIELKGERFTSFTFIAGFILGAIMLTSGSSIATYFAIVFVFGFLAELIGILTKLYFYRGGI